MGFTMAWKNWVATLLSTVSTKVMLNGSPGQKICLACGLCLGDPVPMLFLLVMEVLNAPIRRADSWSLLQQLGPHCIPYQFYVDDLVLFVCPLAHDLHMCVSSLFSLRGASGLGCNVNKCQLVPIRCSEEQIVMATNIFPCQLGDFPFKYLSTPLSVTKLPRSALQLLVDHVVDRLPVWKGRLLHHSGRLILIKTMLTAIPIHTSISVKLPLRFTRPCKRSWRRSFGRARKRSRTTSVSWHETGSSAPCILTD
jgi:hypothetical protein